jgi:D-methionine transport system ATP-binding protein
MLQQHRYGNYSREGGRVVIEIRDLRKIYGQGQRDIVALDGVDLDVKRGQIFGVLGQSGAGKSTLIRCVNLLERPTSGSVRVDGQELTTLPAAALRQARQRIGMIFQHFNLLSSRTVLDNIALPLEIVGVDKRVRQRKAADLLGLVGLEDKANAYPAQLSGGQKQRVGIARALANDPSVLLSDEATSALDPQTTRSILQLIKNVQQQLGLTVLLITHEMNVVKQICDGVAIMSNGRIIEQGQVADLVAQPNSLLARQFFPQLDGHTSAHGGKVVTISFAGNTAEQPIITTLARRFDIDANILGGSIETIGQRRVGQLQVELQGTQIDGALRFLHDQGLQVEVR